MAGKRAESPAWAIRINKSQYYWHLPPIRHEYLVNIISNDGCFQFCLGLLVIFYLFRYRPLIFVESGTAAWLWYSSGEGQIKANGLNIFAPPHQMRWERFSSQVTQDWGGYDHGSSIVIFVTNHANKNDLWHPTILPRVCPNFTPPRDLATYKKITCCTRSGFRLVQQARRLVNTPTATSQMWGEFAIRLGIDFINRSGAF